MNGWLAKIKGFLKALARGERGLSTIPTIVGAISTLAVAGTLAGTVIDQGTATTDDVDKVIQEAVHEVQSAYQIKGSLVGIAAVAGPDAVISQLTFTIALVTTGGSVDFTPPAASAENNGLADPNSLNPIVLSYIDEFQSVENLYWTLQKYGKDDGDNVMEAGELFQITIGGDPAPGKNGGNLADALSKDLSVDTTFGIMIKDPQGIGMGIERRTPSYISRIVNFGY